MVRACKVDDFFAFVVDRVGCHYDVHPALLNEGLAVDRDSLDPLDLFIRNSEPGGDKRTDCHIKAPRFVVGALLAEQRLVKLSANGDLFGPGELLHGGIRLEFWVCGDRELIGTIRSRIAIARRLTQVT